MLSPSINEGCIFLGHFLGLFCFSPREWNLYTQVTNLCMVNLHIDIRVNNVVSKGSVLTGMYVYLWFS